MGKNCHFRRLQFPNSWPDVTRIIYTRCLIPSFPLFLIVSLLPFSNFFADSCRIFPIRWDFLHSFHVQHVKFSIFSSISPFLCFSFSSFHHSFSLSPNFRISHHSASPLKCSLLRLFLLILQSSFRFVFRFNYFCILLGSLAVDLAR